jgi:competence protein ComEC
MLPRQKFRFKRTTLLTVGLIAFLVGLVLSRRNIHIDPYWIVIAGLVAAASARRKRFIAMASVIAFGMLLGCWRGAVFSERLIPYTELYDRKVVLQGVASQDASYANSGQLSFDISEVTIIEPVEVSVPGKIRIYGFGETMVYNGDAVQVEGKLRDALGSRQGQISYAEFKVIERHEAPVDTVRRNFAAGMQNALPEPQASFGLGILIGQRNTLPEATSTVLATVGLTHLIAVSGYNLTIIVQAVRRLMDKRSKYQSALLAGVLIALFLLMTGMSASIVRAAIVSGLTILAWYYGRTFKPVLLIALAACLTAGWNPIYLWSDIGWYLSFLAFFGVLVIAPLLSKRLFGNKEPRLISSVLLETFSAQIMTLPLILYIFQQISFISILSNLLIVPLIPVAMLLSLISGIAGMVIPALAGWIAWPAKILMTYMLDIATLLSRAPHALAHYSLSLFGLILLYAAIVFLVLVLWRKVRSLARHATITEIESN